MISFDIQLKTPLGRVSGCIQIPEEMRLAELAWSVLQLDDQLIAQAVRYDLRYGDRSLSCKKGCGVCCHQVVPVSVPEAFMLVEPLMTMPRDTQRSVMARMAETRELLNSSGLTKKYSRSEFAELAVEYFRLGRSCPFLFDDACSIYGERPYICREFLVTSPAVYCSDTATFPQIRSVPMSLEMTNVMGKLASRLLDQELPILPVVNAVDWALTHREIGARKWPSARLMTLFLEIARTGMVASMSGA